MNELIELKPVIEALIFSVVGIVVFSVAIVVFDKITPFSIWKEVSEKQNVAVAVIVGSMMVAFSIIIAMAHHG